MTMQAIIDRTGLPDTKLGIQLRGSDDGVLVIDMVVAGGLAEQMSDLQNGDRILTINGNNLVGIQRNVIVGWLYENDQTVINYERDEPAGTPSPPKMTMKERLKARAHRDSMKRGLPTGPVATGTAKTSLKSKLISRRQEAEGKPEPKPAPPSPKVVTEEPTTPPISPKSVGLDNSLLGSPSVIILGSAQAVEGIGAVHVVQLMVGAVEGFELADASDDPSHPDYASQVWVHSVERGSEAERQGMAADDVVLAVNGQNARGSNRAAVEGLLFAEEQDTNLVTIVLAKPAQQKPAISDEDLQAANSDGGPQIRRVVLQRPPSGLGLALGPAQAPGGGPAIAFMAGNGPKVLRGKIKPSDEVVAVDGKSLLGVPLEESIDELNGVGDVFELLIREGLPPFVHPPPLDDASMNDASMWSAVENSLDAHAQQEDVRDAAGSPGKQRGLGRGSRSRSGCGLVRLFRDDGGLGFSILGGIDGEMHGIFVTRVAPNSPASGKLAPGDMLLVANGTTLFDVTHADAVDTLNAVNPGDSLDLAIYRNDQVPMWRSPERLRNMFGIISFIEPGQALGIKIAGGVDSKVGHIEVQQVKPDSAAATVGNMFPGDHLIAINGNVLVGKTHEEATTLLKQTGALATFLVQRDSSLSVAARGGPTHMRAFKMKKGNRERNFGIQLASRRRGSLVQFIVRDIASQHSAHPEAHMQVGDEMIAIDGVPLADKTHEEGVELLKEIHENQHVTFVTRRLGPSDAVEMAVTISRSHVQEDFGFGFSLGTSSDGNTDMLISNVEDNGLCSGRLQVGDAIISINGRKTAQMAHADKTTLIDRETQCALVIRRFLPPGAARPPPLAAADRTQYADDADVTYENEYYNDVEPQDCNVKSIHLTVERQKQGGFGFTIGSNADNAVKVITAVKEGSSAYGLAFKGDTVLTMNGLQLAGMPQIEMEQHVRQSRSLDLRLEREVHQVEVDIARDETSGNFGFSVASTNLGEFSAFAIDPLSPAAAKLQHGDRFVRINAADTAELPDHEAAMAHISGRNRLNLVVERPIECEILNTSLDAGGPPVYPDSVNESESAAGDTGFGYDDDGNSNNDGGLDRGDGSPQAKLRRKSSTTFVWTQPKSMPTGATVLKTVTLVRDPASGFGFNFDTDEHLNHDALGLGVSIASHINEDQLHHISGTREGTPAFGKLFIGDLINSINGMNAKETSHDDILDMLHDSDMVEIIVERAPTDIIHINLERHEGGGGFGFSLVPRGAGQPLLVKVIQQGSPADGKMRAGDILDTMNGVNTATLSNDEAKSMVMNADALEIELHRREDANTTDSSAGGNFGDEDNLPPGPPSPLKKPRLTLEYPEEVGNGYEAACAFATRVFSAADTGGGGVCTASEIKDHCNAYPEDKARLVGEIFTWDDFFADMGGAEVEFDLTKFIAGVVKAFAVAGGTMADEPETPLPVAPDTEARNDFDGAGAAQGSPVPYGHGGGDDAGDDEFAATAATVVSAAAGGEGMPEPPRDAPPPPPPPMSPPSNFTRSPASFSNGMSQRLEAATNRLSSFDGGGFDEDDYTAHRETLDSGPLDSGMTSVVTIQKQNGALGFSIEAAENGMGVYVNQVLPGGAADMAAGSNLQSGCRLLEVNGVNVNTFSVEDLKAELARHTDAVTIVYQPLATANAANNRLTLHMSDM